MDLNSLPLYVRRPLRCRTIVVTHENLEAVAALVGGDVDRDILDEEETGELVAGVWWRRPGVRGEDTYECYAEIGDTICLVENEDGTIHPDVLPQGEFAKQYVKPLEF
jgi:hypothetical protein